MTDTISARALAAEFGLDQRTVSSTLAREGVARGPKGYDANDARAAIALGVDTQLVVGHAASGRGAVELPAVKALAEARAEAEHQRSRRLRLANDKAEGLLLDKADVTAGVLDVCARAKHSLLQLGARLATRIVGTTDAREIKVAIDDEVAVVVEEFRSSLLAVPEQAT